MCGDGVPGFAAVAGERGGATRGLGRSHPAAGDGRTGEHLSQGIHHGVAGDEDAGGGIPSVRSRRRRGVWERSARSEPGQEGAVEFSGKGPGGCQCAGGSTCPTGSGGRRGQAGMSALVVSPWTRRAAGAAVGGHAPRRASRRAERSHRVWWPHDLEVIFELEPKSCRIDRASVHAGRFHSTGGDGGTAESQETGAS